MSRLTASRLASFAVPVPASIVARASRKAPVNTRDSECGSRDRRLAGAEGGRELRGPIEEGVRGIAQGVAINNGGTDLADAPAKLLRQSR